MLHVLLKIHLAVPNDYWFLPGPIDAWEIVKIDVERGCTLALRSLTTNSRDVNRRSAPSFRATLTRVVSTGTRDSGRHSTSSYKAGRGEFDDRTAG